MLSLPFVADPACARDVVVEDRVLHAAAVVDVRNHLERDVGQAARRRARVVGEQVAHDLLPRLEPLLVPIVVPLARLRPHERILHAAAVAAVRMLRPHVERIVRHDGSRVHLPHVVGVDPALADVPGLVRIEHDATGGDVGVESLHRLLLRVVDLEDHVRVIQRHVVFHAARFGGRRDFGDAPEVLRPHVDVHLEARRDAEPLAELGRAQDRSPALRRWSPAGRRRCGRAPARCD